MKSIIILLAALMFVFAMSNPNGEKNTLKQRD